MENDSDMKRLNEAQNKLPQASMQAGTNRNIPSGPGNNPSKEGWSNSLSSTPRTREPRGGAHVNADIPYSHAHRNPNRSYLRDTHSNARPFNMFYGGGFANEQVPFTQGRGRNRGGRGNYGGHHGNRGIQPVQMSHL